MHYLFKRLTKIGQKMFKCLYKGKKYKILRKLDVVDVDQKVRRPTDITFMREKPRKCSQSLPWKRTKHSQSGN